MRERTKGGDQGRRRGTPLLVTAIVLGLLGAPLNAMASPLAPSAPSKVTATSEEPTVHLTWAPAQANGVPIDHYNVYRRCRVCEEVTTDVGSSTSFDDSGVLDGVTYSYSVAAVNAIGEEGPRSEAVSATPLAAPGPGLPAAPRGAATSNSFSGNHFGTLVTWSRPADGGSKILQYRIYRSDRYLGPFTMLASVAAPILEYEDRHGKQSEMDDSSCDTYFYRVRAVNGNGEGPGSAIVSGGPATVCPPE